MIKIVGEPGSGKTKRLMKEAAKSNGVFLCMDPDAMMVKANSYGYLGSFRIVSYYDYLHNPIYKNCTNFYIDDLDEFILATGITPMGYGLNNE